jgi:hypothetical protein
MRVNVCDFEANNLYPAVDKVWCGAFSNLEGTHKVSFGPTELDKMVQYMDSCDVLIGHNVIGYDFPMLKKVLNYEFKGKVVDTLIMSRLLNPKRILPANATNRAAGPHSIYAWGVRVGVDKPEHNDWTKFSADMLHRCTEDVEINRLVYLRLMEEAEKSGGRWKEAFLLSFKLFQNLQEQEDFGWFMDQEVMHDNVRKLEEMMIAIDNEVIPQLPYIVEVLETKVGGVYSYVKKPFLKSGSLNRFIDEYFAESVWHSNVGGPFTRSHWSGTMETTVIERVRSLAKTTHSKVLKEKLESLSQSVFNVDIANLSLKDFSNYCEKTEELLRLLQAWQLLGVCSIEESSTSPEPKASSVRSCDGCLVLPLEEFLYQQTLIKTN